MNFNFTVGEPKQAVEVPKTKKRKTKERDVQKGVYYYITIIC